MRRLHTVLIAIWLWPAAAAGQVEEYWQHQLDSGTTLDLVLRRPDSIPRPLPAIILLGGFEGAARVLDNIDTDRPIIRASFAYPWQAPEDIGLADIPAILDDFGRAVRDTIAGVEYLVQALRQRDDVDASRIVAAGASAGAPFITIGGQQVEAPALIIVQGFGEVGNVITRQFVLSLQDDYGAWIKPLAWLFSHFLVWQQDLPAPEQFAARLAPGQKVLMVTAIHDQRIPASATQTLWQAIESSGADAARLDRDGDHLRGYGDPEIRQIMHQALDWMAREDLLPATQ